MSPLTTGRLFYGWIVVAAAFTVTFVGFGSAYAFSAFVHPLQIEFGASRGSVALVFAWSGFLYFSFGAVSGRLADRWGARPIAMLGMVLVGSGLALASAARTLFEVCLAYGLGVGLGIGCAYVPVLGVVQRWFDRRRGLATGIAVTGIGVGTLVMPPVAAALIESFGWRHAYLILGGAAALLGVAVTTLIVSDPAERGLQPDGATGARPPPSDANHASVARVIRSRPFLWLYGACFVASLGVFVPFVHLVPYAQDIGTTSGLAAALMAAIGVGSTIGRLALGNLADRIGRQQSLRLACIGMGAAMILWAFATSFTSLVTFAVVLGVCYGAWVAVLPAVVVDFFGRTHVSTLIGVLYTSVAFGTLLGPSGAGFLFDMTSSYTFPILASAVASLASAFITPPLPQEHQRG